jgi:hypothetical protein
MKVLVEAQGENKMQKRRQMDGAEVQNCERTRGRTRRNGSFQTRDTPKTKLVVESSSKLEVLSFD